MSINRNMSILAAGASSTGGLSNVASIGIGMTPSNILDITQNQNASSAIRISNSTNGGNSTSGLTVTSSASSGYVYMTAADVGYQGDLASGLTVRSDGVGGISNWATSGSLASSAFRWTTGASEVARIDSSGNFGLATTTLGNAAIAAQGSGKSLTVNGAIYSTQTIGISNPRVVFYDDANYCSYVSFDPSAYTYFRAGANWIFQAVPTGGTRYSAAGTTCATLTTGGSLTLVGALSKASGSFRIEHPLPSLSKTHQLVHSFIEGPMADLIYSGKVSLVAGTASVNIDTVSTMTEGTFVLLCRNVRCFTTNESDWTPIKGSVSGNILTIVAQDNTSTATISWMVIGERQDKHMYDTEWTDENGKVIVEPLIPPAPTLEAK